MRTSLSLLAGALLAAGPALAHTDIYTTTLHPTSGTFASGSGSATITIDWDDATMRVQADFAGLSSPATAAHIHCCTTNPGIVSGAIVATTTPTFPGFPTGTSGSYDVTFSLDNAATFNSAFISNTVFGGNGSLPGAVTAFGIGLNAGKAYLNIHTANVPSGEIQGFLALAPVPEPATYGLMALGLLGVGAAVRRRA
ncbi:CHRD domain-containing protein [Pelomonas sp. KK5]|uniref:CHRD domain-containing protein n=1 Tax=Pelomonas sp. KK5 TaxID=1855730 RepID=UPI00097C1E69|nr:CHRD domain-containing protein [Pelomonas sp. KK5]